MILNKHSILLLTTVIVLLVKQFVTEVLDGIDADVASYHHMLRFWARVDSCAVLRLDGNETQELRGLGRHIYQCDEQHDQGNYGALRSCGVNITVADRTQSNDDKVEWVMKFKWRVFFRIFHCPLTIAVFNLLVNRNILTILDFGKDTGRNDDDGQDGENGLVDRLVHLVLTQFYMLKYDLQEVVVPEISGYADDRE